MDRFELQRLLIEQLHKDRLAILAKIDPAHLASARRKVRLHAACDLLREAVRHDATKYFDCALIQATREENLAMKDTREATRISTAINSLECLG